MVNHSTLSKTSDVDVMSIKGNVSEEQKRVARSIFEHFVSTREKSYGADVGERLRLVEVNVLDRDTEKVSGQTVFEIELTRDMCNIFGTLHGACAAYMIDPCSVSSLVVLGNAIGYDGTGVSQSMSLVWHQPARVIHIHVYPWKGAFCTMRDLEWKSALRNCDSFDRKPLGIWAKGFRKEQIVKAVADLH